MREDKKSLVKKDTFCSLFLNNSEFALSVSCVQEVINSPDSFSIMPLAPHYLKGLINLRGTIIPVIDLKEVLDLKGENGSEQKIAIVYSGGSFVGLLFDKTGEVFRENQDELSEFLDEDKTSVIKGVFRKNEGQRIIQILDIQSIFCLKNLPKKDNANSLNHKLNNNRGKRRQVISFIVGPSKCSLEITQIQEILMVTTVNESALAVGNCIGTFNLRGMTVPIIDFASMLKFRPIEANSSVANLSDRRIVVMRIGQELFGLLVDKVDSIISYFEDELKLFPALLTERKGLIKGCISVKEKDDVLLLDESKIFTDKEIEDITHGHSKLYNAADESSLRNSRFNNGIKRTFITFSIEQEYAINIIDVREIIDLPPSFLIPPGMPSYFRGIVNLRGEMVMIVDSREMYQKNKKECDVENKILILKSEDIFFGLIVDSVQSIISLSDHEKIKLPDLIYRDKIGDSKMDIAEVVQYKSNGNADRVAFILDAKCVAKRILTQSA